MKMIQCGSSARLKQQQQDPTTFAHTKQMNDNTAETHGIGGSVPWDSRQSALSCMKTHRKERWLHHLPVRCASFCFACCSLVWRLKDQRTLAGQHHRTTQDHGGKQQMVLDHRRQDLLLLGTMGGTVDDECVDVVGVGVVVGPWN